MSGPTVRELSPGPERDAYLPLLELADDSVAQVRSYYQTGTLFALDADDGSPMGMPRKASAKRSLRRPLMRIR